MPTRGASHKCAAQLLAVFVAFAGAGRLNASSPTEAGLKANENQVRQSFHRQYKASAYVTLLSVPIFSRAGVGFGFAGADEQTQGARQSVSLQFLSGSTPERAHGLNRFGFIQENAELRDRVTIAVDYFGLMTASAEESLHDAKVALNSNTRDRVPFVAARAVIDRNKIRYSVRHMLLPSSYRGSNADQLLRRVEAEFATPQPEEAEKSEASNERTIGTFLCSLRQAIQTDADVFENRIIFNGKTFEFRAGKRLDGKVGAELQRAGVTALPEAITQLNGTLRNEKTNEATSFRLWFEKGAANFLPLRFEFKPKSYLRLVFDEDPPPKQILTLNRELPQ